jgi:hypothetical protein
MLRFVVSGILMRNCWFNVQWCLYSGFLQKAWILQVFCWFSFVGLSAVLLYTCIELFSWCFEFLGLWLLFSCSCKETGLKSLSLAQLLCCWL